jgi:type I restriction enzyme S subunit
MKLNKQNWNQTPIGDVVECVEKHDKNPLQSGVTNFVGLENIEAESLKIVGSGNIEDGTTFSKTFKDGDVLFGKRRAYLRKVAVADFDGICSTDILVFRAKEHSLLPDLLPYYVSSDSFFDYAVSTSAGSLSPRTKWRDLALYKIPLPPLDEQQRLVKLFQNIEQSIIHAEEQEANLLKLKNQLLRELFGEKRQFGNYLNAKDFEKVKFEKVALSISERIEPKQTQLEIYVGLDHLDSDDLVIRRKGKPEDVIGTKLKIYKGDVIFGKRRAYLRKLAVSDFEGIVSAHSMVLRANEENIEKDFLPYFMQSDEFMNRAVQISEGSLSPTIKWKTLAQQEFVLPKKEMQSKLIDVFKQFDETRELVREQIETLKKLKQKLLNEILS